MKISADLFQAYLKCPTKCWLRAVGELATGNAYAEWVKTQDESYRTTETARLLGEQSNAEVAISPGPENLKSAKWKSATNVAVQAPVNSLLAESNLHAVERIPSRGRGQAAQFIPIRFIFRNKLTKDDKLLLAFDAFVLSETLGREVSHGKIIHGDLRSCARESAAIFTGRPAGGQTAATTESVPPALPQAQAQPRVTMVKAAPLVGEVRKRLDKLAALLTSEKPPDLVLNRHCAECEFRDRCRKLAIEQDDLSLLAGMSAKERQKLRSKGIFTVTQLSYTFRPRRRPKRLRDKREKYHHSLKALAIREKKIHIVGSPELKIEGTPVYLDVEGLPDRDFYYLIGLRIGNGDSAVQHSLWADTIADEGKIWREFLAILETVEKPVLIHYGSYETNFLKQMKERHGNPQSESNTAKTMDSTINLVSVMFGKIYFPTFSNGLKEVASWFGSKWTYANLSGIQSIKWRDDWESAKDFQLKNCLVSYNSDDCAALEQVVRVIAEIGKTRPCVNPVAGIPDVINVDGLEPHPTMWPKFASPIKEFEQVNKAARWDYQRDRVFVRFGKRVKQSSKKVELWTRMRLRIRKSILCPENAMCPSCGSVGRARPNLEARVLHDLAFRASGVLGRLVEYKFRCYWCRACKIQFGRPREFWCGSKFGSKYSTNLVALLLYESIELGIHQRNVVRRASRLYGLNLHPSLLPRFKREAAEFYKETREMILERIRRGLLVHMDETRANVKGTTGYVWVFTNLYEVAYLYSDSREGEIALKTLPSFTGVLVSDFYSAYDSFACPQQRCLIHLIRDLNQEVLDRPFDNELKRIVVGFAEILKPMIETVDRYGLKKHFLRKHLKSVERFYRQIEKADVQSEAALRCKERFEKNRGRLFTFLEHDGIPWNNNNAEHAIKAFAALRDVMSGSSTQQGLEAYLILLSVCQTCKYMGVDFLDFLRSGEKDIHAFAESRRGRRKPSVTSVTPVQP